MLFYYVGTNIDQYLWRCLLRLFLQISGSTQASGAYIFRPATETALPLQANGASVTLVTGPVVNEFRSEYAYVSQSTRLWAGAAAAEIEWTVGPVDVTDKNGHEVCFMSQFIEQLGSSYWGVKS